MKRIKIERRFDRPGDYFSIWLMDYKNETGTIRKFEKQTSEELPDGHLLPEPSMTLEGSDLIAFGQALIEAGFIAKLETADSEVKDALRDHVKSLETILGRVQL